MQKNYTLCPLTTEALKRENYTNENHAHTFVHPFLMVMYECVYT